MPYLAQPFRDEIDKEENLEGQCSYSGYMSLKDFLGYLNYKVFRLVKNWLKVNGKTYFHFAAIVGTLICSVFEIYRRLVIPYENEKIIENGDV